MKSKDLVCKTILDDKTRCKGKFVVSISFYGGSGEVEAPDNTELGEIKNDYEGCDIVLFSDQRIVDKLSLVNYSFECLPEDDLSMTPADMLTQFRIYLKCAHGHETCYTFGYVDDAFKPRLEVRFSRPTFNKELKQAQIAVEFMVTMVQADAFEKLDVTYVAGDSKWKLISDRKSLGFRPAPFLATNPVKDIITMTPEDGAASSVRITGIAELKSHNVTLELNALIEINS